MPVVGRWAPVRRIEPSGLAGSSRAPQGQASRTEMSQPSGAAARGEHWPTSLNEQLMTRARVRKRCD